MPQYGDLVTIVSVKGKRKLHRILENADWHTQHGIVAMTDVVNASFGAEIKSAIGVPFRLERPQLFDLIMGVKRQTQIMYPKDMGLICLKLGVGNGRTILEAGSGSGGFTLALSWFSGEKGHIHSYEAREEFSTLAKRNVTWAGLGHNVSFHVRDIANGFGINDSNILNGQKADALFLDVRTPWDYLDHALEALVPGAPIAFLLPCIDQVSTLLFALEKGAFENTEVLEILVRAWKPVPDRLRPADRMTAHTCFLVFTKHQERSADWDKNLTLGTRERKQQAAREKRLGITHEDADCLNQEEAPHTDTQYAENLYTDSQDTNYQDTENHDRND